MSRSKKIFLAIAAFFFMVLFYVSYDIGKRTSFPGSKAQLKERIKQKYSADDSLINDTLNAK